MSKGRKRIGRGVSSILSQMPVDFEKKEEKVKAVQQLSNIVATLPIQNIETYLNQPRKHFDDAALAELAQSIKVHGLIQPITVRRLGHEKFQLISGERRLRAAKMAQLQKIPAYIRLANDQEMLEMALVENIQRENLNPIEIAITYQRLKEECSLTDEKLANRVGKNRTSITNYLRLLTLPSELQTSLKNGRMTMGHAKMLAGKDVALQLSLHTEILEKRLSVREVEDYIRRYKEKKKKNATHLQLPPTYQRVQDDLGRRLDTRVSLKRKKNGKGQIVINFNNDTDLNRILELIQDREW